MAVYLSEAASSRCVSACESFVSAINSLAMGDEFATQSADPAAFDTARQLSTVYSLFAGADLNTLLNGFVDQARAMSMLFAAAGGLIEAQDEAVAATLGKAAEEPAGLQSLGLMGSLTATIGMIDAIDARSGAGAKHDLGGYEHVGPEDVSGAPLARMVSAAEVLDAKQFNDVRTRVKTVAAELQAAGKELRRGLSDILNDQWQGAFATQATVSVDKFAESVDRFVTFLGEVESKSTIAENGFDVTRKEVPSQAAAVELLQSLTPGTGSGPRAALGPPSPESAAAVAAAEAAAEEQARAIVNTVYSPAVMDANLADLDVPTPYRVVSTSALGGVNGLDVVSAWNVDGVFRPAGAAAPSESALVAALGVADGAVGGAGAADPVADVVMGATTTRSPIASTDAATEQALLAARAGTADGAGAGAGAVAASAGQSGAGGGVNAAMTAAGAPFAPVPGAGQQAGAGAGGAGGAGGIRGIRGGAGGSGDSRRSRDRGFGSTAGLLGGGGAAAAGAGASRMGGAGTLAGFGAGGAAGPGIGGPVAGVPGAGSAGAGAAGPGAGAFSSSSTGTAQAGRAGAMPMGAMMGAAGAGQNNDRRGHTPASYLTNATNTTAIIGDPVKVAPAVLGRAPAADDAVTAPPPQPEPFRSRVIGRDYTGGGAERH